MEPYQELTLYQRSAVLMAAAKLGLFAALAERAATAPEVANRVTAPIDSIARLLAALAALEYISRDGELFALNDFSRAFLRGGAGGMARLAWKEHVFYTAWSRLSESISTGKALFPSFSDRVAHDFPSVEKFLLALNDLAEMAAPGIIGTGAFNGVTTILDLGGGGGGYAAELAAVLHGARVTLADLPEIIPIAMGHLARKGLQDRVELVAADFLKEDCAIGRRRFDCVFMSHVLHDFDASTASAIVARAAHLVRAGGKLVILDVLVPEEGQNNPVEALFDLMMLVEVPGGRSHRISDVREWIVSSGMASPKSHKLYFGILLESHLPGNSSGPSRAWPDTTALASGHR
jgi:ubiquinone/menaquinone biosynthesis C-methylase UbiE